jgi:hypothetical protein
VRTTVASATDCFPVAITATRQTAVSASAATAHIAVRVTQGAKVKSFHQATRISDGNGGCALDSVENGMSEPVRKKSHAAGM